MSLQVALPFCQRPGYVKGMECFSSQQCHNSYFELCSYEQQEMEKRC